LISAKSSKIPIKEEVSLAVHANDDPIFEIREKLRTFDISKIRGTREREAYTKNKLIELANLLNIPSASSETKPVLVEKILMTWKKLFPEDFESN